jgi:alpha-methylacyl-CoA racemase
VLASPGVQPLAGLLVVDLSRYLPGAFATSELRRLGARVVRLEPPEGDPMRAVAPAWHEALNGGKESVACDLKHDATLARALCRRADVVVESFRPGVVERLGVGPEDAAPETVYCSISGFGRGNRHERRAGHDINYLGWAGVLHDTAPTNPPVQIADLAGGSLAAVTEILAALLERQRTGSGRHLVVSMTHRSHALAAHRLGGDPLPRFLTGALACYRIYRTADGHHLTVGALEPKFFARLCEVLGRPELAERQYDPDGQEELAAELAAELARRPLAEWLERLDGEDVCVGPVWTLAEAADELGRDEPVPAAALGEHTERWRAELDLSRATPGRERPSAAGRASRLGSRPSHSGWRPSRSRRNASIPSARAPSTSSCRESPTIAAASGATPTRSSAAVKIPRCGLVRPNARDPIATSTSSRWWATKASRSRPVLETRPSRIPYDRSSVSTGSVSS